MIFEAQHLFLKRAPEIRFSDTDAPDWITSADTIKGSTMDNRWFWEEHVLTLKVGASVKTDFHVITRTD